MLRLQLVFIAMVICATSDNHGGHSVQDRRMLCPQLVFIAMVTCATSDSHGGHSVQD